jgi:predicted Zn-dependent protease
MRTTCFKKGISLVLITALTTSAFAQDEKKFKPLDEKNDPTLVGKRDINKGQLAFYSIQREVALGRQMAAEVDRGSELITDPAINEYVNRVAQNIVLHSDAKIPFTVKVINSDEVNAFALPGGFLYVNRGLLEAAENEAEVAGVLAHEISHVTARHGIEQASKGELLNYASIPLIFFGGLGGYLIRQAAGLAVPLTFLKFSRGAEKEADRLGAQYMWAAGYDPNALITFFEKLQAKDKRKPGTLSKVFSTHPLTGDRITEVRDLIARFPDKGEYQISTSEFGQIRSRLITANASNRQFGRDSNDRRPTLKRRPQGTDSGSDNYPDSDTQDRPVLKRKDSSSSDQTTGSSSSSDAESSSTERPVLKRTDGTPANDKTKPKQPAGSASETERPTLKRRTDSDND